jgi:arylsulfatase A-like enzyme
MTGRYNFRTGIVDVFGPEAVMDAPEVTLAERLKAAGYATGIFGKWHLGDDAEHGPNAQGFDEALVHRDSNSTTSPPTRAKRRTSPPRIRTSSRR